MRINSSVNKNREIENTTSGKKEVESILFSFWQSDGEIPAYLKLCIETWYKNIPGDCIHIISYNNIDNYIEGIYDINLLKELPLPMQSDIIAAAVLEKFGGFFIDIDTIITKNIFEVFNQAPNNQLIAFGDTDITGLKSIHLAVLYCSSKGNSILKEWRIAAQKRLKELDGFYEWNHFGNAIVNPLLNQSEFNDSHFIIDRTKSGNILESAIMPEYNNFSSKMCYLDFYFNEYIDIKMEAIKVAKFGIISLHNSWTPNKIKEIKSLEGLLNIKFPIISLLKRVLNNHYDCESLDMDLFKDSRVM